MSAIFGILHLEQVPIDPAWIKSMQHDLAHRGPDGQGLYQEDGLVLGNMLLQVTPESIYDKSPFEEDGLVITANARLDEREVLMDRLNIALEEREKITDSLLLLRSYRKYGKDFVKDIYGDFSLAIWDKEKKQLFCARDQMGVKPFLYYFQDNRFVFSTEIKSIVKLPFVKQEVDNIYLRNRAIGIWDEPQKTTWKNILRLETASILELNNAQLTTYKYWVPTYKRNNQFKTEESSAIAVRELLEKVIADHTRVIGGVGAPLSGGLDSSSIVCLAARKLAGEGKEITTVSSIFEPGFTDPDNPDEMPFINEVLQQEQNIDPKFVYHSKLGFINGLDKKFDPHFAPTNIFHYVDEAIYEQFHLKAIRRVLSGYLGDLTVSNNTINPLTILLLTGRFPEMLKLGVKFRRNAGQSIPSFLKSNFLGELAPKFIHKIWNKLKGKANNPWGITEHPLKLGPKEKLLLQRKVTKSFFFSNRYSKDISENIWPTHTDHFEEDWDCGSSYHQIEMTFPLCDRRLVELLLQIPVEHFYAGGLKRGLLRKGMQGALPDKIRNRKNKGAYSPGYPQIIKKEILQINSLLQNGHIYSDLDDLLDLRKLILLLKNLSESKNNSSFDYQSISLVEIMIWYYFSKWYYKF